MRHSVRAALDPVDPFANKMRLSIDFHHKLLGEAALAGRSTDLLIKRGTALLLSKLQRPQFLITLVFGPTSDIDVPAEHAIRLQLEIQLVDIGCCHVCPSVQRVPSSRDDTLPKKPDLTRPEAPDQEDRGPLVFVWQKEAVGRTECGLDSVVALVAKEAGRDFNRTDRLRPT